MSRLNSDLTPADACNYDLIPLIQVPCRLCYDPENCAQVKIKRQLPKNVRNLLSEPFCHKENLAN